MQHTRKAGGDGEAITLQPLTSFTGTDDISDQSNWQYLIHKYIPDLKNKTVLDVGCASGFLYRGLERDAKFAVGTDIRKTATVNCFIQADCHRLPFKDQSFDLVISLGVLEHVTDYKRATLEMKRLLTPYGYLFLMMGPTPIWKHLDNREHRETIPENPSVNVVLDLLSDGLICKLWGENIEYRLFKQESFKLFPTNLALSYLFKSNLLRRLLFLILSALEKYNLEQNICIIYQKKN